MKRLGGVYGKICDFENLLAAHKNASKEKSHYSQVQKVNKDLKNLLLYIQNLLKSKSYKVSPYKIQKIIDNGKERELYKLPYYPDRIIQWAIMLQIENTITKTLCYHTCASIKGRGISRAVKLSKKYTKLENQCKFCLKIDIKKFYPNIDKEILKNMLRLKFKDKDLLWLLDLIIDSYPNERGLPIGSYLSQYLANFYLSKFDHWLKETLKLRYVVRYMDDICIYSDNKPHLHAVLAQMREYLSENLKLTIKENYQIFPTRVRGVDFVGYRFFGTFTLLRKSIIKKIKKRVKIINKAVGEDKLEFMNSFYSYIGFLKQGNTRRFFGKYMRKIDIFLKRSIGKKPTRFKE